MDRLKQRADFLAAARGPRVAQLGFVMQHRRRDDHGPMRVGMTLTKKVGTATERNRIRRRLRAAMGDLDLQGIAQHSDYVIVGRRVALSQNFSALRDDLKAALLRLSRPLRAQP